MGTLLLLQLKAVLSRTLRFAGEDLLTRCLLCYLCRHQSLTTLTQP